MILAVVFLIISSFFIITAELAQYMNKFRDASHQTRYDKSLIFLYTLSMGTISSISYTGFWNLVPIVIAIAIFFRLEFYLNVDRFKD